jgi:hypothetical protein
MPTIAALANNIVFFIIILLCWYPPFAAQLQDCFADKRSSLMQINQFLYRDDVATIARAQRALPISTATFLISWCDPPTETASKRNQLS